VCGLCVACVCVARVCPVCGRCVACVRTAAAVYAVCMAELCLVRQQTAREGNAGGNTMLKADRVSTRAQPLQPHKGAASAASRCAMNPGNVSSAAVAGMGEKG
jgi:hypothetical protein